LDRIPELTMTHEPPHLRDLGQLGLNLTMNLCYISLLIRP